MFVEEAVKLKMTQKLDLRQFEEESQMASRKNHPVIPSPEEISKLAL